MIRRQQLALVVAIAIPVLGVVELIAHLAFARRAPTAAEWAAAKPRVEALRQPGDLVVIAPRWAEPHGRMALGEELLPLVDLSRPDESRYPRAVELSAAGQHLDELSSWRLVSEQKLDGGLLARVLENPSPAHVITDFTDLVDSGRAEVTWEVDGRAQPCPWRTQEIVVAPGLFGYPTMPARRFVCGREGWQSVGVTVQDDDRYLARRCIWSHPPSHGQTVIRFHQVALGAIVRGHLGIHATLDREGRGAPVDLKFSVDGDEVGAARHVDGQGWERSKFEIPLGSHAGAASAEITVRVVTSDANERHLCWEADTR